jgi:hypothetical protein
MSSPWRFYGKIPIGDVCKKIAADVKESTSEYGLYIPPKGGKPGKWLRMDKTLGDYSFAKEVCMFSK